jgi:hypothetical protein
MYHLPVDVAVPVANAFVVVMVVGGIVPGCVSNT